MPPPWPQIDGGLRACSLAEYSEHYSAAGNLTERLTLTRARPIAGDADLGARFMASSQPFVYREEPDNISTSSHRGAGRAGHEIELLTQSIQLAHGARNAALRHTGTLGALEAMGKAGLIAENVRRELDHAYVFLRTAEHRLQLGLGDADLAAQVERSRARVRELCATLLI